MVEVRAESPEDLSAIREVHDRAFGGNLEGRIVDALRSRGAVLLSLVATMDSRVVAHILFSPASVGNVTGAALGPMAVLPEFQRQGIGSRLVEAGNRKLEEAGCPFVVLVGHPDFYPRFGYSPASLHGITCEWDVSNDAFLLRVLDEDRMRGVSGLARYRREFSTIA